VHEAYTEPALWQALAALLTQGGLAVRVRALLGPSFVQVPRCHNPEWLRAIGAKGFADGALGSRGAQLREPYADAADSGLAVQSDAELAERAAWAAGQGLQMAIHAIGDEGARRVLDLYQAQPGGLAACARRRWRIEHGQTIHPDDLPRLVGLCLATQPIHFWADGPWAKRRLGPARLPWSHRALTLMEAGAVVGFGSDYPIETADVLAGLAALEVDCHPEVPEWDRRPERPTRLQACDGYWRRAAFLAFDEGELGRLLPGYWADWVCLDGDPFAVGRLSEVRVVGTAVGGRWMFGGPSAEPPGSMP
jgi:predicted amidohydrolase YtcJ